MGLIDMDNEEFLREVRKELTEFRKEIHGLREDTGKNIDRLFDAVNELRGSAKAENEKTRKECDPSRGE